MAETDVPALFASLQEAIEEGDYDRSLHICDEILAAAPDNALAKQCKVLSFLNLQKFQEAMEFIMPKKKGAWGKEAAVVGFVFERAYCLYRLNRLKESAELLNSVPAPRSLDLQLLEAQVAYRLQDFDTCIRIYEQLLKDSGIEVDKREVTVNLTAALVSSNRFDEVLERYTKGKQARAAMKESHELAYNIACALIDSGDLPAAKEQLQMAEDVCRKSFADDSLSEDEIRDELAVFQVQLAYILQRENQTVEATEMYTTVLKNKPSDPSVVAVAANNLMTVRGAGHSLFDSLKRINQAASELNETRLTARQRIAIAFNRCLLLLQMNKFDECKTQLEMLQSQYPDDSRTIAIQAALLLKEKNVETAVDLLKNYISSHKNADNINFILAQIQVNNSDWEGAASTLRSSVNRFQPGVVTTVAQLYERSGNMESSCKALEEAVDHWQSKTSGSEESQVVYASLLRAHADLNLKMKRYPEATASYQKILEEVDGTDIGALSGLVFAASYFKPSLAEQYQARLPRIDTISSVDAEELENAGLPKRADERRQQQAKTTDSSAAVSSSNVSASTVGAVDKKKKKKKNKIRYPKNFDPSNPGPLPDPDRWKPKRERASFKKLMKKKHAIGKGPQGAVPTEDEMKFNKNTRSTANVQIEGEKAAKSGRRRR